MASWQRLSAVALQLTVMGATVFGPAFDASALPASYSGAEIRGSVVDAETKQPLEGVHVVAQWILYTVASPLQMHRGQGTPLQIMETITDARGEYYFPPWGPKPRPFLSRFDWGTDPVLTFFKAGYRPLDRTNYNPPPDDEAEMSQRISRWHGRTVALEPFRGTTEDWVSRLYILQIRLGWAHETGDVVPRVNDYWRYMPSSVLAVLEQRRLLPESVRHRVKDLDAWNATEAELRALAKEKGPSQ